VVKAQLSIPVLLPLSSTPSPNLLVFLNQLPISPVASPLSLSKNRVTPPSPPARSTTSGRHRLRHSHLQHPLLLLYLISTLAIAVRQAMASSTRGRIGRTARRPWSMPRLTPPGPDQDSCCQGSAVAPQLAWYQRLPCTANPLQLAM
jgi:hypothetical protein